MPQSESVHVTLLSFSYSFGIPKNVDLLYSVRNFPVPDVDNYQKYDGRHKRIQNALLPLIQYEELIEMIIKQVTFLIQNADTKSIAVAVGCEKGQHRSVAVVERAAEILSMTYNVEINHRDLHRIRDSKKKQQDKIQRRQDKYDDFDENN